MPEQLSNNMLVATEEELLEFANKIRQLGGAEPITELPIGRIGDPNQCLIARSLNFSSTIRPQGVTWPSGATKWSIILNGPDKLDLAEKVAELCGSQKVAINYLDGVFSPSFRITLPEHIGNAAAAFDQGLAFSEYALSFRRALDTGEEV